MEITVNIPQNDYVQPTEARQEVVQEICDILLNDKGYITLRKDQPYRLFLPKRRYKGVGISWIIDDDAVRIRGVEVQAAFEALLKADYHIYDSSNVGYLYDFRCSKTPFVNGKACSVTEFNIFID